jgi:pimeloyl-ACP methyl ester carboxylesterase
MGNFFTINSFTYIDNYVADIIYNPPLIDDDNIKKICLHKNVNMFYINNNNNIIINVLEMHPEYFKYEDKKIIIFSHGNACDNFSMFNYLNMLANELGIIVCSYDYPQYGLSSGTLNEKECCKSLEMVIKYYLDLNYNITLVAQSIGTGILVDYISKNKWNNTIILISPYMSIPNIAIGSTSIDSCVSNNKYDSINKMKKIKCKVKIFHGEDDKLINIEHAYNLYELLPNKSIKPTWIKNCDHHNILEKITLNDYKFIVASS